MFINLHCHKNESIAGTISVINVEAAKNSDYTFSCGNKCLSFGIHPWKSFDWEIEEIKMLESLFDIKNVIIIGEIGFDKYCSSPKDKQLDVFISQLMVADKLRKPVLLHNVGGSEIIFKAKSEFKSVPAWIMHGFRGNLQEMQQLSSKGFYFSFGEKYNIEALKSCDKNSLFIETDVSDKSIEEIYRLIAETRGESMEELVSQVETNFAHLMSLMHNR